MAGWRKAMLCDLGKDSTLRVYEHAQHVALRGGPLLRSGSIAGGTKRQCAFFLSGARDSEESQANRAGAS